MSLQGESPRLPKWIFLVGDAALLATAAFVASHSARPSSGAPLIAIVGCVALAAICGVIPFVADYARSQDEAIYERRRALEGMARTVASSAEQVAITASGLHQIADLAQKNLKHAEQLTQRLQERIAELQAQVAETRDNEKEEIARIESASEKISKTAADSAKFETAVRKAMAAALADFEAKAAAAANAAAEKAIAALASAGASLAARATAAAAPPAKPSPPPPEAPSPPATEGHAAAPIPEAPSPAAVPMEAAPLAEPSNGASPSQPEASVHSEALPPRKRAPKKATLPEAMPPLAFRSDIPAAAAVAAPASEAPAASRPIPGAPAPDPEPGPAASTEEFAEPALSTDGATRLLVTAYIGIGNRLFIRGDGPGLSWDKGIPLQFVSIGKWRWETSDAPASVRFKLYKNDEMECSAVGQQTIEPGRQRELTAAF